MSPRKLLVAALPLAALLCVGEVRAQRLFVGVGFETLFDNREYGGTRFADLSETLFSARLSPEAGVVWGGHNALVAGADLRQDFGDGARFLSDAKPRLYYRFTHPLGTAAAGVFPRTLLRGDYHEAFFDRSYLFYHNLLQGLMGAWTAPRGFLELAVDWEGKRTAVIRERFRILSAGERRFTAPSRRVELYGAYALTVQHLARRLDAPDSEGVVDDILFNPRLGVRFCAFFDFDLSVGYLQALQRDRIADEGWHTPCGARVALTLRRGGWLLANTLYVGGDLQPLRERYSAALYDASPLYATAPSHRLYDRFEAGYGRAFFDRTLDVSARALFDFDGRGLGTAYVVEVGVRLQKIFGKESR